MKLLLIFLLFPIIVFANEIDVACDLEKSKAEISALIAEKPQIISTIGNDDNNDKAVTLGLTQSLSGIKQGSLIRSAANAKCDSIRAATQLQQAVKWSIIEIQQESAEKEIEILSEAINLASEYSNFIYEQLQTQNATLMQYTEILELVTILEKRKVEVQKLLAIVIIKTGDLSLQQLIESARHEEAKAQGELAKASAETGWDIIWSIGAKQTFEKTKLNDPNKPQNAAIPQVQILFKYSFGASKASRIAESIEQKTKTLLEKQELGFDKIFNRLKLELEELIRLESIIIEKTSKQLKELSNIRQNIQNLNTKLAQTSYKELSIKIKILQVDYYGSQQKRLGYVKLLNRLN